MKLNRNLHNILLGVLVTLMLFLSSCEQYEYASPSPGILEIRFKSISDNIEFNGLNNFVMSVTEIRAIRNDDARLNVYQDTKAIRRDNSTYNVLQPAARDSSLVIGQTYAPPGDFKSINIQMSPIGILTLDGYRLIPVFSLNEDDDLLQFSKPFRIEPSRTTVVTLTIDLDRSLVRGADEFIFYPYYYISSIIIY